MKMPSGSSFIFPVKSANTLKAEDGGSIILFASMICDFPIGVTGSIEMPCSCYQVTGIGTVNIEGTIYTLPTDEAVVKIRLQETTRGEPLGTPNNNFLNKFTILTNIGGIQCEYLINRKTWLLFHNNIIEYDITSGSLSFERIKAPIPLDTIVVSVKKGNSPSFTINYDKWFTADKSFKIPVPSVTWDNRTVIFSKDNSGLQPMPEWYNNYTPNTINEINAGTNVIDRCFASRLIPKDKTAIGSLTLSFVSIDGSSTYYTLDGSTPDITKTLYTVPFTIFATTTIKWINIMSGYANSHINSRLITIT
jgi:hypothetical protein